MKTYTIIKNHTKRATKKINGTLQELINYFSYALLIGNSHKKSINKSPKTIKSLISNLQKSFEIKEGSCYEKTNISLK